MTDVHVIFCFDDRILTGAGVSILSMLDAAADSTSYVIHILHPGFDDRTGDALRKPVEGSRHQMVLHHVPASRFENVPTNRGSWTEIVYYRLLASEIVTECDRAIYSDVDVLICKDLAEVYATDMDGCEWAGVAAEANVPPTVMHRHFPENDKPLIYFSGFMVMDLDLMRRNGAVQRYFEVIETVRDRLKFFDLDLLNIATPRICRLPFDYVVLEDVYEMPDVRDSADFAYLKSAYSAEELEAARQDPAIIHYAGRRGKPWHRRAIPEYYNAYIDRLPALLRRPTLRDLRKRWLGRKGRRSFPSRTR